MNLKMLLAVLLCLVGCEKKDRASLPGLVADTPAPSISNADQNPVIQNQWSALKALQASIQEPNLDMVTSEDQPLRDTVHLTDDGYKVVGGRIAQAWNRL